MKSIDTNYLLRYILHDDEAMFQKACKAIEAGAATRLESIPEVIYVLSKSFGETFRGYWVRAKALNDASNVSVKFIYE